MLINIFIRSIKAKEAVNRFLKQSIKNFYLQPEKHLQRLIKNFF
jgi:predicted CoA-binding protein